MGRKARPVPLSPAEQRFRMDEWITRNLTVEDRSGPEWLCVCPRCGRTKLAVHIGRKAFQCLYGGCSFAGWSPTSFVRGCLGISPEAAREIVAAFALGARLGPVGALSTGEAARVRTAAELPAAPLPPVVWGLPPPQAAYIAGRGISPDHAQWFGLATALSTGSESRADRLMSGRVLFPVWAPSGRIVFWVGRAIDGSPIKTLNTPRSCREDDHSVFCTCYHDEWGLRPVPQCATADEVVLGTHLVRPGEPVIVVEGPVDAAVCGPGFVATLRSWCSPAQAAWIAATGASEAIILYDGDDAGLEGAEKARKILSAALPTRVASCPAGEDPGSLGRERSLAFAHAAPRSGGFGKLTAHRYTQIPRASHPVPMQAPLKGR